MPIINKAFVPSEEGHHFHFHYSVLANLFVPKSEIARAENILFKMEAARRSDKGAFGLDMPGSKGGKEMIDEPMLKQVCRICI